MCLILKHFFLSGDCPDEDRAAMSRCVWRGLVKTQHLRKRGWRKRHLSGEFLTLKPRLLIDLHDKSISGWLWWTTGLSKRRPTRGAWSHVLGRRLCRTWLPWRVCRRFKYAVRNNYPVLLRRTTIWDFFQMQESRNGSLTRLEESVLRFSKWIPCNNNQWLKFCINKY